MLAQAGLRGCLHPAHCSTCTHPLLQVQAVHASVPALVASVVVFARPLAALLHSGIWRAAGECPR